MENTTLDEVTFPFSVESNSTAALEDRTVHTRFSNIKNIIFLAFGIFGVLGNGVALLVLCSSKALRHSVTNMFVINQSLVDLLASMVLVLQFITKPYTEEHPLDSAGCKVWVSGTILWSLYVTSTYNMLAMTAERFLKIVHPLWHRKSVYRKHAVYAMVGAWAFGFAFNLSLTVPTSYRDEEGNCHGMSAWPSTTAARAAGVMTVVVEYFLPLAVLLFCYGSIVVVLRQSMPGNQRSERNMAACGASTQRSNLINKAYLRSIRMMAMVAVLYLACWTLNQVYFLMFNLGVDVCFCDLLFYIEVFLVNANSCLNPLVYLVSYDVFRRRLAELTRKAATERNQQLDLAQQENTQMQEEVIS